MSKPETLTVSILDKDYQLACPPDERPALKEAAHYLDQQMRSIRKRTRVISGDKIAVMAAINITYEMLNGAGNDDGSPSNEQMQAINAKLDEAIARFK